MMDEAPGWRHPLVGLIYLRRAEQGMSLEDIAAMSSSPTTVADVVREMRRAMKRVSMFDDGTESRSIH